MAWVTAVAQVWSLARELTYATEAAKKRRHGNNQQALTQKGQKLLDTDCPGEEVPATLGTRSLEIRNVSGMSARNQKQVKSGKKTKVPDLEEVKLGDFWITVPEIWGSEAERPFQMKEVMPRWAFKIGITEQWDLLKQWLIWTFYPGCFSVLLCSTSRFPTDTGHLATLDYRI